MRPGKLLRQALLLRRARRALAGPYWLGVVDARPLALFRMALALVVIVDALDRLIDLRVFYTDEGILPRALLRQLFGAALRVPTALVLGTPAQACLLLAIGSTAALLLGLGVFTRAASIVVWLYLLTIVGRNPFITDGGDDMLLAMSFWAMFADLEAVWSLRPGPPRARVEALPVRLLECQVALVYLAAAVAKSGPGWRSGEALFHVLQNNDFARPLGMAMTRWPMLCAFFTFATLATELLFAPLLFSPWKPQVTRAVAAATAALMHLGIGLFLRVGMFTFVMLASLCLLVPAAWLGRSLAAVPLPPDEPARRTPAARARAVALTLVLAAVAVTALAPRRTPRPLLRALFHCGLAQAWTMFAPDGAPYDGYWSATGILADGRTIDPLRQLAPEMLPQASLRFSRWYKLRDNMVGEPSLQLLLLRYACRRMESPPLVEATLRHWQRPTRRPGQAPQRFLLDSAQRWRCR